MSEAIEMNREESSSLLDENRFMNKNNENYFKINGDETECMNGHFV